MRIIQFLDHDSRPALGLVKNAEQVYLLEEVSSTLALAKRSIESNTPLSELLQALTTAKMFNYTELINAKRILSPITLPDPSHLMVSGTGLTHLGSADTRAAMHAKMHNADEASATDSMKMFKMGLEGGKPQGEAVGVQPEWFYKGDGLSIAAPEQALEMPHFALDGGEEPEIAGIYLIGPDHRPYRIGFSLGNEFSDHKMERINYLYLAHSKLRPCSIGPELLIGELPKSVSGESRIRRRGEVLWRKEFLSGEDNMSHSIANLEAHHFKYPHFLQPGHVHVHFFGTGTLSFADGFETQEGDVFEIESAVFGRPLRNPLVQQKAADSARVKSL